MSKRIIILSLLMLGGIVACTSVGYYGQAISGQLKLIHQRQPIARLLASDETEPALKARLQEVQAMRQYAVEKLALPDNKAYTGYSETGQEAVVWNVIATPAYSLEARTWCFPVAGCVPYRGYFRKERAERFADKLRTEGMDVVVSGATAYSTLGFFADPVLDTMLSYPTADLAGLLFHELAHQRVYVRGDADFNEALATAVERAGLRQWLADQGDSSAFAQWEVSRERSRQFAELLANARNDLAAVYAQGGSSEEKFQAKQAGFDRLRTAYQKLKRSWDGYNGYDQWMNRPLNNADLALNATYESYAPRFEALLAACNHRWNPFFFVAEQVADLPADKRSQWLNGWRLPADSLPEDCAGGVSARP